MSLTTYSYLTFLPFNPLAPQSVFLSHDNPHLAFLSIIIKEHPRRRVTYRRASGPMYGSYQGSLTSPHFADLATSPQIPLSLAQ